MLEYEPIRFGGRPDPYTLYRELRAGPRVHWAEQDRCFCVSRYDDVAAVLKDPESFSSSAMNDVLIESNMGVMGPRLAWKFLTFAIRTRFNPFAIKNTRNLVSIDPPRHDAMRSIVNRGFTPKRIAVWEGRARAIVRDRMKVALARDEFDVVADLAVPLPLVIISEMLGVEAERQDDFKRWTTAVISLASGTTGQDLTRTTVFEDLGDLFLYLRQAVQIRKAAPRDDLISVLLDPQHGDVLSEFDAILFVVLLLVAGSETTTNLIGNAVEALLERPQLIDRVAEDPSLVPAVVEEALRFDSPIQLAFRRATRDLELAGRAIPKDSVVVPILGSANRDPARFEDPDCFDIDRDTRGHLSFGLGVHFCLGSSLARLEARVALEELIPELRGLKRVGPASALIPSFLVNGRQHIRLARTSVSALPTREDESNRSER